MNSKEYSERFEKLYKLFTEVYLNFYTWKGLQDKNFEKIFAENNHFWSAVLFSLENTWLTGLAKAYENSSFSKRGEVISVSALLPHQTDKERATKVQNILESNKGVIKNIQKLRHNQLAHHNAAHSLKPKALLRKFPIKYVDVEKLLSLSNEILTNLNLKEGHGYAYKMLAEDSEHSGKHVIEKLQYYSKLHHEHMDNFRQGKTDSPHFPPRD